MYSPFNKRFLVLVSFICFIFSVGFSQDSYFGFKARIASSKEHKVNIRLTCSAAYSFNNPNGKISGQVDFSLYRGGLGANLYHKKNKFRTEINFSALGTVGRGNYENFHFIKSFNAFQGEIIPNDFKYSGTMGTHFVLNDRFKMQRVGSIQTKISMLHIGYINDGMPPFAWKGINIFGDGEDRWWTGAGFISLRPKNFGGFIEWEFAKYTGFAEKGFDLSEVLQLEFVLLNDMEEQTKNINIQLFNIGWTQKNDWTLGLNYRRANSDFDIQEMIHKCLTFNPIFTLPRPESHNFGIYSNFQIR